jgi:Secretion system C-terminal sorting domain
MKKLILLVALGLISLPAFCQITITAADMPVAGDTLRTSSANPLTANVDLTVVGASQAWDYSSLVATSQTLIDYQTATQVNPLFGLTISSSAYGYKVADSLSLGAALPVSLQNVYTFFEKKTSPSTFDGVAFAATLSGLPLPENYSDNDEIYFFPLTYGNPQDSSTYALTVTVPSLGTLKQQGYRITTVDAWGTIMTPYYTTPTNCIRVRSEITEVDSITFMSTTFGIPRQSVDYKWLVNGDHYPALWVTTTVVAGTETPSAVNYRDSNRRLAVKNVAAAISAINVYPNPAVNSTVTLEVPADWHTFSAEIFDIQGKLVCAYNTQRTLNIGTLASGQYLVRVTSGNNTGYARITK